MAVLNVERAITQLPMRKALSVGRGAVVAKWIPNIRLAKYRKDLLGKKYELQKFDYVTG